MSTADLDLLTLALQVSNSVSDATGDEEMRGATSALKTEVAFISARRRAAARKVPHGVDATQRMPKHSLHFLCTLCKNYVLYEKCGPSLLDMRSSVCENRLYSTEPRVL